MHISNALKALGALSYELERSKVTERQSEASHRDHEVSGSTASVEWAHAGALSCHIWYTNLKKVNAENQM